MDRQSIAHPHQQHCRSNVRLRCQKWQKCRTKFRPFVKVEHVQFVAILSKGRNFVPHCCRNRQHCCQKLQRWRSNIRFCQKNRSTCSIRQCCFNIVMVRRGLRLSSTLRALPTLPPQRPSKLSRSASISVKYKAKIVELLSHFYNTLVKFIQVTT